MSVSCICVKAPSPSSSPVYITTFDSVQNLVRTHHLIPVVVVVACIVPILIHTLLLLLFARITCLLPPLQSSNSILHKNIACNQCNQHQVEPLKRPIFLIHPQQSTCSNILCELIPYEMYNKGCRGKALLYTNIGMLTLCVCPFTDTDTKAGSHLTSPSPCPPRYYYMRSTVLSLSSSIWNIHSLLTHIFPSNILIPHSLSSIS